MWPVVQVRNVVVTVLQDCPELWYELLVRVLLLILVCLLDLTICPYKHYLTPTDFNNYKRPRRESFIPLWATIVVVVLVPLMFFSLSILLSKNYVDTIQSLLAWTLALSMNALITEVIKLAIGRPRPDFFYRCFPDGRVTEELSCTALTRDIIDGRKSFPSGHSSFSFCSMGFLSLWLCGRLGALKRGNERLLAAVACSIPLVVAALVGISRYFDNHHHWEDVAAGSLLGFGSSYVCYALYYNPLRSDLSGYPYIWFDGETVRRENSLPRMPHSIQIQTDELK